MRDNSLVDKTADFVKERLSGEGSGHDWWHVYRVWQLAKTISEGEPSADKLIVELGALLHDIADWKFTGGDMEVGPQVARDWLTQCDADEKIIKHVEDILRTISFKGAKVPMDLKSIEAKIVFDADKLDAIGAIGIARTFTYGATIGQPIYEPGHDAVLHDSFEEYQKHAAHNINHFYEKLLLLKDMMYTKTAKKMAVRRHQFMLDYLEEFYQEWDGKA